MGHVNESDIEGPTTERGVPRVRRTRRAGEADGDELGCSLYELPPGGKSWPFHYHGANAEAVYVLAGEGTLRGDAGERPLEPGDYVAFPPGPTGSHRVVNDGDDPLRYLATSTMREPDVMVYPDSEKVGVFSGAPPGGDGERDVDAFFRRADAVSYWDGEE